MPFPLACPKAIELFYAECTSLRADGSVPSVAHLAGHCTYSRNSFFSFLADFLRELFSFDMFWGDSSFEDSLREEVLNVEIRPLNGSQEFGGMKL